MQNVVERDIIRHRRRGIVSDLGDMSEPFKFCCTCFPYFCGELDSKSKEEMVWPRSVWNMFLEARTDVDWSVNPMSWRGRWLHSVNRDIVVLEEVTLETPVSLVKDVSIEVERVLKVLQELK
jgi:hypothetical protein